MTIEECVKNDIQQDEPNSLKCLQVVNVGFINSEGKEDETQFDIVSVGTPEGTKDLVEVYANFCKENNIEADTVMYLDIVLTGVSPIEKR